MKINCNFFQKWTKKLLDGWRSQCTQTEQHSLKVNKEHVKLVFMKRKPVIPCYVLSWVKMAGFVTPSAPFGTAPASLLKSSESCDNLRLQHSAAGQGISPLWWPYLTSLHFNSCDLPPISPQSLTQSINIHECNFSTTDLRAKFSLSE